MSTLSGVLSERFGFARRRAHAIAAPRPTGLSWGALPAIAQVYVALVIVAGTIVLGASMPLAYPRPLLFLIVLAAVCLTAAWKVNLPIPLTSGSTLSVSYAAKMMALLLFGPSHAVIVAVAGAFTQCTYKAKRTYPFYRTLFSMTAEAITMAGTGAAYVWLGGPSGVFDIPLLAILPPATGAILIYFLLNTGLIAGAIALSTGQPLTTVWRNDFLWSSVAFMAAGSAGAVAAIVINRGHAWIAISLIAPVYLTYRTYQIFVARIDNQERHMAEMREAHEAREREYQAVYDSAQRQAQQAEELLDIARVVSGQLRLELTRVDLKEVVRSALNVTRPAADAKRIRIELDADASIGVLEVDRARFQQIARNLLSNAVKFTPPNGRVHARLRRANGCVELIVADSGQGIPREFLPALFEPFRQADESTTRANGDRGLGLSVVKRLVEAHGGTVSAHSDGKNRGATFTVRLPDGSRNVIGLTEVATEIPPCTVFAPSSNSR